MARRNQPKTPLLALLRELANDERRAEFAALCGTTHIYLYQLAICSRKSCRADLAKRIADASEAMGKKYGTRVLTQDILATMCSACVVA